ncbi:hypothetical protein [Nocardioides sp. KR10-350]|uniref:hypothetical protein n=1 Tax=Nocardioides cheoyonin TaxID=3156615 RepID=UPI0032B4EECB
MPRHSSFLSVHAAAVPAAEDARFELADVRRYARLRLRRFVSVARTADRTSFRAVVRDHLGVRPDGLPVVAERWPAYEHVNVQAALDAALARPDRQHEVAGSRTGAITAASTSPTSSARTSTSACAPATSPG